MIHASVLQSNISVLEILHDFLKQPVVATDTGLVSSCPACGHRLYVTGDTAICENKFCEFRAGNSIDLLKVVEGDYKQAADTLINSNPIRFHFDTDHAKDMAVRELESTRILYEYFLKRAHAESDLYAIDQVQTVGWLRVCGIEPAAQPYSLFILSKIQWQKFAELASNAFPGEQIPKIAIANSQCVIVIPLFASPATISGFVVIPAKKLKEMRIFQSNQYKFGFTGLLDMHPECQELDLHTNFSDAFGANTTNSAVAREKFAMAAYYEPRGRMRIWEPNNGIFDFKSDDASLLSGISELAEIAQINTRYEGHVLSWREFVCRHVLDTIRKEYGLTPAAKLLINSLRLKDPDFDIVIQELKTTGDMDWAAQVDRLRQIQMLRDDGKASYFRSSEGYYAIRNDGSRVDLSNFVIKLETGVSFADNVTSVSCGKMHFCGREYPIILTTEDLQSPKTLEDAARRAELMHMDGRMAEKTPTVFERLTARGVLTYLQQASAALPRAEGLDGLGWSKKKHAFYTPWGKISLEGINRDIRTPNPRYDFWSCFDLRKTPLEAGIDLNAPIPILDMISQIIGVIGRSFIDFAVKAIGIAHTTDSNTIVRAVFRVLGQTEALRFNEREGMGLDIKGVHGFPLLITGATRSQIERSTQSFVALGDHGLTMYSAAPRQEIEAAAKMLPYIVEKCVRWILSNKGAGVMIFNSVNFATAVMREGAGIISAACDVNWPVSQPIHATIERLLNQIPFTDGAEYFTHHLSKQRITIDLHKIQEVNSDDLRIELMREAQFVSIEGHLCHIDSMSFLHLLDNFYGKTPPMNLTGIPEIPSFNPA